MSGETRFRRGPWRWRMASDEAGRTEDLVALVERRPAEARAVKTTDGRRAIWTAPLPGDGVAFIKHYSRPRLVKQLKALVRNSRTRQEWEMGRRCQELGLPVARHLAMAERRRLGLLVEDCLIQEALQNHQNFDAWFETPPAQAGRGPGIAKRRDAIIRLARLIRRMHDLGVVQRDFKPDSVMVGPDSDFKLVDLERALIKPRLSRAERLENLAKLDQTFAFIASDADRIRFLREYFHVDGLTRREQMEAAVVIARRAEQLARKEAWDRRAWAAGNNMIYRQLRVDGLRVSAHYEMPRVVIAEAVKNLGDASGREFRCQWKPGVEYIFRGTWCDAATALAHVPALQYRKVPFVPARAAIFPPGSNEFGLLLRQEAGPPLIPADEGLRRARDAGRAGDFLFALGQWLRVAQRMGIWWREFRPDCILYDPKQRGLLDRFFVNRLDLVAMDLNFEGSAALEALDRAAAPLRLTPSQTAALRFAFDRCTIRRFRAARRF